MRKLHLNPDELRVESFQTAESHRPKPGTVHAREASVGLGLCTSVFDCSGNGPCSDVSVCACDGTYTQRPPYCDPSANTYCVDDVCFPTLRCD